MERRIRIGTAGWSIPRASATVCHGTGTHLERYARVFACAEVNSSFHRPHAFTTYQKWAASTPDGFRFAVKLPRAITHDAQLRRVRRPLEQFLSESAGLGDKRGPLLVQLPPSFEFDARVVSRFFELVRTVYDGGLACEPRHVSWASARANDVLRRFTVARVAADPPPFRDADRPAGWTGLVYFRLHGSPRKYWSRYDAAFVRGIATGLMDASAIAETWCLFDNTASGAALANAWELQQAVGR